MHMPPDGTADFLRGQRSVRDFTPEPVDDVTLNAIFDAARSAPTAGGMHNYCVIVTRDPSRVEQYRKVHQGNFAAMSAPVLLTICVDQRRLARWLPLQNGRAGDFSFWGFLMGAMDGAMFAQNVNLAVQSAGLAGSFVGSAVNYAAEVADFLQCPPGVIPLITYVLGHPAGDPRGRTRLPADILVHQEVYRDATDSELIEAFDAHASDMFALYIKFPGLEAVADALGFNNGNMAEMWSKIGYVSEQVEAAATWYLSTLQQQGFLNDGALRHLDAFAAYRQSPFFADLTMFNRIAFTFMVNRGCFEGMDPARAQGHFAAFTVFAAAEDPALDAALRSQDGYLLSADLADRLSAAVSLFEEGRVDG